MKKCLAVCFIIIFFMNFIGLTIVQATDKDIQEQKIETKIEEPIEKQEEEEDFLTDEQTGKEKKTPSTQAIEIEDKKEKIALMSVSEEDFTYDTLSDGTIAITDYTGSEATLKIPSTIDGKKVSTINSYAFYNNLRLKELVLPDSIQVIESNAFAYCFYLNSITWGKGLQTIGSYAFQDTDLEGDLILPDSVTTIGGLAFYNVDSVTSVSLGKNVKSISNTSFSSMNNLTSFSVNSSNTNYSSVNGVLFNKNKTELIAYPIAKTGTSYTIPSTVKTIGENAFYQNKNLSSVTIPNSVTQIERGAFAEASKLSTVSLGNSVTSIEEYAFNKTAIQEITIPASVTYLDPITFIATESVQKVNIASNNTTYTSVDGIVFSKDKTKIVLYPSGKVQNSYSIPSTVKTIGENAFNYAPIKQIVIPSSVTTMEDFCFGNSSLTSVTVPSSVTKIGYGPFDTCRSLTKAVIQAKIKVLEYRFFAECEKLSSVTLSNSIEELDSRTFYNCTSLTSITLPSNLKTISYSFLGCTNLKKVIIPAGVTSIVSGAFEEGTQIDISKTKLQQLEDGTYVVAYDVYLTGTFDYEKAYEVLDIVNQERTKVGLSAVQMDKELLDAAMERAKETALYFDHTRPVGLDCFSICDKMSAENITAGLSTAKGAMEAWMDSPGHKANILTASRKSIGVGCYYSNGIHYWVQCFSSEEPQTVSKPANKTEKQKIKTTESVIDLIQPSNKNVDVTVGKNKTIDKIGTINTGWQMVYVKLEPESFTWSSGNKNIATVNNKGQITGVSTGTTTVQASIGSKKVTYQVSVNLPFTDVPKQQWYYNTVSYCYSHGIITGTTDTTFSPNENLSRAMLVTILWRMAGTPSAKTSNAFPDVKEGIWYTNAIKWATGEKIVSGYDNGKFGPNDNVTREQLAVMLRNYANYKKKNTNSNTSLSKYSDNAKVSSWAKSAMQWAVGKKIVSGKNNGTSLDPKGNATRAEAAAMVNNYIVNVK